MDELVLCTIQKKKHSQEGGERKKSTKRKAWNWMPYLPPPAMSSRAVVPAQQRDRMRITCRELS